LNMLGLQCSILIVEFNFDLECEIRREMIYEICLPFLA